MSGPKWYHIVLMIGGAVALGTLGGKIVAEKAAENQREWERFEASHGGCWRTGAYDVSTSLVPIYGPDASGNLTIITFDFDEQVAYAKHEANATSLSPAGGIAPHMEAVRYALVHDAEYAWSWFCNLKMPHIDAGASWASASEGAARFLSILTGCELDITKHPNWANNVAIDARRDAEKVDTFPEVSSDRNVMSVTVEAPAHHGGQMVATALAQFLRKVLPSTEVISRRGAWDPVTLLAHEAAVRMAVDEGKLEIDDWNKDLTNEREFGVVVQVRPNRELRFDRRAPKD